MLLAFIVVGYVVVDRIFLNPDLPVSFVADGPVQASNENEKFSEQEAQVFDFTQQVKQPTGPSDNKRYSSLSMIITESESRHMLSQEHIVDENLHDITTREPKMYHLLIANSLSTSYIEKIKASLAVLSIEEIDIKKRNQENSHFISAFKTRKEAEIVAFQLLRGIGLETKLVKF
jgi:hypothetical protein